MTYCSIYEDIVFIEGSCEYLKYIKPLTYKKDLFYNQQLKNLSNVKHQLAKKAKRLGANAIVNFKYGQKNTSWFRSLLLSLDDNVNWFGTGDAVVLSNEKMKEILEKVSKN